MIKLERRFISLYKHLTTGLRSSFSLMKKESNKEFEEFCRRYPPKAGKYHLPSVTTESVVLRPKKDGSFDLYSSKGEVTPEKENLLFQEVFLTTMKSHQMVKY